MKYISFNFNNVNKVEPAISKKEDETTNLPEIINNSKPLSRRQSMKIINRRTMKSLMRDLKPIIHENKKLRSIMYLSEKAYPHHLFDGRSSSGTKVLEEELAKYKEENSFLQEICYYRTNVSAFHNLIGQMYYRPAY